MKIETARLNSAEEITLALGKLQKSQYQKSDMSKDADFEFDDYAKKIFEHGIAAAIKIEDDIVGIALFYANDTDNKAAFLSDLVVDNSYQGMGLGRKLMDEFENISRANGMEKTTLTCNIDNENALGFYNKLGYYKVKKQGEKYLMAKDLSDEKIKHADTKPKV